MADSKGYEVLVDELTIHKAVRQLVHPITGDPMGYQQGAGETWFLGEVVPAEAMNPEWAEALDSGEGVLYNDLSKVLAPSSGEPALNEAYRMGLPFEGYDDMEEDDILAAMRVLPSPAVMRIKDWETAKGDEAREAIVNYNIGYGESPDDRVTGRIAPEEAEGDESKAARAIRTREVDLEAGTVVPGEGITGTGDPQVAPGTAAKAEAAAKKSGSGGRSGRRPRPAASKSTESGSGSGSSSS